MLISHLQHRKKPKIGLNDRLVSLSARFTLVRLVFHKFWREKISHEIKLCGWYIRTCPDVLFDKISVAFAVGMAF